MKKKVTYKGKKYSVQEETEHKVKLTDGYISFWAKKKDVK